MTNDVLYEVKGDVAVVTINRPQKRNALNMEACTALRDCWRLIESDASIRAGIVTGAGDRAFCAGFDIDEKQVDGRPETEDFAPRIGTRCLVTKPLIAAVNGLAVAAGVALVEACDLCIASEAAWFSLPEVRLGIGVQPFVQSLWSLPQKILMEFLLTGERLSTQRAYELGFVNRVVPQERVLPVALALATQIAANAPLVVRASKSMIYAGQSEMGTDSALRRAEELFEGVESSADAREGFRAWQEHRDPVWRGE